MSKFKVGDWVIHPNNDHLLEEGPKEITKIENGLIYYTYFKTNRDAYDIESRLQLTNNPKCVKLIKEWLGLEDECF